MQYCGNCGRGFGDSAKFCPYCGAPSAVPVQVPRPAAAPAQSCYEPYAPRKASPIGSSIERDFLPEEDRYSLSEEPSFTADMLPEKYRPIGHWEYFGLTLLFLIPVIGWVIMFVLSFRNSNINRRNFAMSFLCFFLLFGVAALIVSVFFAEQVADLIAKISSLF